MNKGEVINKVNKFLKKQVNWKPWDKSVNLAKEYDNERYLILSGRDDKNSSNLEVAHFVDRNTAQSMLDYSVSFRDLLVDLKDMSVVDEQSKCICNIPRKSNEYKKVKCYYCKQHGPCDYDFCR